MPCWAIRLMPNSIRWNAKSAGPTASVSSATVIEESNLPNLPKIVMVGAFPPPVHGMAMVNTAVRAQLQKAGVEPLVIDLAAPNLNRALANRLRRLPKAAIIPGAI